MLKAIEGRERSEKNDARKLGKFHARIRQKAVAGDLDQTGGTSTIEPESARRANSGSGGISRTDGRRNSSE